MQQHFYRHVWCLIRHHLCTKQEQQSKWCFYLVTTPENTSFGAVVVNNYRVRLPGMQGSPSTHSDQMAWASKYPSQNRVSGDILQLPGPAGIICALGSHFRFLTQHKIKHKMTTISHIVTCITSQLNTSHLLYRPICKSDWHYFHKGLLKNIRTSFIYIFL